LIVALTEQSVGVSLPMERLSAHMLLNSPFVAATAAVGETKHYDVAPTHDSAPFGVPLGIYSRSPSRSES
jgi:hypothetical protein